MKKNFSFRPDIIIHKRGDGENNLVAFELKKGKLSGKDKIKLKALTNKNLNFAYKYRVGLSNFNYGDKSVEIIIFENGEIIDHFLYKNGDLKSLN